MLTQSPANGATFLPCCGVHGFAIFLRNCRDRWASVTIAGHCRRVLCARRARRTTSEKLSKALPSALGVAKRCRKLSLAKYSARTRLIGGVAWIIFAPTMPRGLEIAYASSIYSRNVARLRFFTRIIPGTRPVLGGGGPPVQSPLAKHNGAGRNVGIMLGQL